MTIRRLALLTVLLSLGLAAEAAACSCVARSPQQRMADADAAFIGEVTAIRSENGKRVYTVEVAKAYKGAVGETAEVRGGDPSTGGISSCDELFKVGDTLGGFFTGAASEWAIFSCNRATREDLEAGADGFPEGLGNGVAVALITGPFAGAPYAVLDTRGRTIAYARGGATFYARVSVCPGSRYAVEATDAGVRTRRLADLKVVRTLHRLHAADVACLDASGRTALVSHVGKLLRVRGGAARQLWKGPIEVAALGTRVAAVALASGRIVLVDAATGRQTVVRRTGDIPSALAVSPAGHVAVLTGRTLEVLRRDGTRASTRTAAAGTRELGWDGERAIAVREGTPRAGVVFGRLWWAKDGQLRDSFLSGSSVEELGPVPQAAESTLIALPGRPLVRGATTPGGTARGAVCRTA